MIFKRWFKKTNRSKRNNYILDENINFKDSKNIVNELEDDTIRKVSSLEENYTTKEHNSSPNYIKESTTTKSVDLSKFNVFDVILQDTSNTIKNNNTSIVDVKHNNLTYKAKEHIVDKSISKATNFDNQASIEAAIKFNKTTQTENNVVEEQKTVLSRNENNSSIVKTKNQGKTKPSNSFANNFTVKDYIERINKIFDSINHLFAPFKDIIIKVAPFLKPGVWAVEKIFSTILLLLKFFLLRLSFIVMLLKSKVSIIIVAILVMLFFSGAVITRFINTPSYIKYIENEIQNQFNYKAGVSGNIIVRVFPTIKLSIKNINLIDTSSNNHNELLKIKSISVEEVLVTFKIIPLLWGNLEIKTISVASPIITLNTNNNNINNKETFSNYVNTAAQLDNLTVSVVASEDTLTQINNATIPNNLLSNSMLPLQQSIDNKTTLPEEIEQKEGSGEDLVFNSEEIVNSVYPDSKDQLNVNTENSSVISFILKRLTFNNNINSVHIIKGKLTVIDDNNNKIFSFENINLSHIKELFANQNTYYGNTLYDGLLYYFQLDLLNNAYIVNLSLDNNFNNTDYINIKGNYNNNLLSGQIEAKGKTPLSILAKFIVDTGNFNKSANDLYFTADYSINNNNLLLENINFKYFNNVYKASFNWALGLYASIVTFNIASDNFIVNQDDGVMKIINNSNVVDFILNNLALWNNKLFDHFKATIIDFNIDLTNANINGTDFNEISLDSFVYNDNLYINNFKAVKHTEYVKTLGKLEIDKKQAHLLFEMHGENSEYNLLPYNDQLYTTFLQDTNGTYSIYSKLILQSHSAIFNNINAKINNFSINNATLVFLDRVQYYEFIINASIKDIGIEDLKPYGIWYLEGHNPNNKRTNNLLSNFIVHKNLIKLNLNIDNFKLYNVNFKNVVMALEATESGINIKNFIANGKYGGQASGSINIDLNYAPIISGSVSLNNLFIQLDDLKNLIVPNYTIVGNAILNGKIRFNSNNYNSIDTVDGEINFIKQERLKINATNSMAKSSGIYLTLSNNSKNSNVILVNDLFGSLKILQNKISFYPVFLLYIKDNQEYRGSFQGDVNLNTLEINTKGKLDKVSNINSKIEFNLDGTIGAVVPNVNYITIKQNNTPVKVNTEKDILQRNAKTHTVVDNLNNTSKQDHFNNNYNIDDIKNNKDSIDSIFENSLDLE